eukprot:15469982-Alexandrium_andersonii.AAC.1
MAALLLPLTLGSIHLLPCSSLCEPKTARTVQANMLTWELSLTRELTQTREPAEVQARARTNMHMLTQTCDVVL